MHAKYRIAAKHVSLVDRVIDVQRTIPQPWVIQRVGEDIDLAVSTPLYDGAFAEFDDRTLGSLVRSGLQGN